MVIAIIALMASAFLGSYGSGRKRAELRDGHLVVIRTLESARSRALSGFGTGNHGVHIYTDRVAPVEEIAGVPTEGIAYHLPPNVTTDTDATIMFLRISGKPNPEATTTIQISHSTGLTATATVSANGAILPE